jgi:DNA-binding GntR family transcriptional regulator
MTAAGPALADPRLAVVTQVRAAILAGELVPNQRLVETDLCERFGTSRFVARSALQQLASMGLVEFQRNRGARVRAVSIDEAIEITEVRKLLEGLAARRAAERVSPPEADQLRAALASMRAALASGDVEHYRELNAGFHTMISDIAGHGTCSRLLRQLSDQTARYGLSLSLIPGRAAVSMPQHEAILVAITARDPAAAERAIQAHLQTLIDDFRALRTQVAASGKGYGR